MSFCKEEGWDLKSLGSNPVPVRVRLRASQGFNSMTLPPEYIQIYREFSILLVQYSFGFFILFFSSMMISSFVVNFAAKQGYPKDKNFEWDLMWLIIKVLFIVVYITKYLLKMIP